MSIQSKIPNRINKINQENLVKNKHILHSVTDAILLCGKQGISLQGVTVMTLLLIPPPIEVTFFLFLKHLLTEILF